MVFHILSLFPEMIDQGLSSSILGRAREQGLIRVHGVNIRDFTDDRHGKVDDYTYGGGAGMLMQAQPVYEAWRSVTCGERMRTVYVTPQGRPFDQRLARELAGEEEIVILCGHYEGIDERVLQEVATDEVSIGDYVLTGGELAAMVMVDAIARLVPDVLHNGESAETESFRGKLLEYPQYSRPRVWHGQKVPEVLLSGDKRRIEAWRLEQSERRTRERRPDLYAAYGALIDAGKKLRREKLLHTDMLFLLQSGQGELLYHGEGEILLRDSVSGLLFHARMGEQEGEGALGALRRELSQAKETGRHFGLVFHQRRAFEELSDALGLEMTAVCVQAVWTPREKLPVRGLYRPDGRPMEGGTTEGLVIKPLESSALDAVREYGDPYLSEDYYRERIERGQMAGAFFGEELAGFIGIHPEGSVGMLAVLPSYRGRHVGMALETYMLNRQIEQGLIAFGQILEQNETSAALQSRLGLKLSKTPVYWTEKK